jgi:hypothetical protein
LSGSTRANPRPTSTITERSIPGTSATGIHAPQPLDLDPVSRLLGDLPDHRAVGGLGMLDLPARKGPVPLGTARRDVAGEQNPPFSQADRVGGELR